MLITPSGKDLFKDAVILLDQGPALAVHGVGTPALVAGGDFLLADGPGLVHDRKLAELSLHPLSAGTADFPDDLAGVGKVGVKSKKVQPVPQREDIGLAIELKAPGREMFLDAAPGFLEHFFVFVDEVEIVHIPAVVPYPQDLLDEVVQLIEIEQRIDLRALVPNRDADVARRAVYDCGGQCKTARVRQQLRNIPLENVMADAGEIVVNVGLEHPALRAAVPAVILPHEVTEAVEAEVGALPDLGTVVVQDKRPGQNRVEDLVAEGVLHDLVLDAIRLDEPLLRLIDKELIVGSGAVGSFPKFLLEAGNSLQRVGLYLCDGAFPSLPLAGGPVRCIQICEVVNGFKRLIWFQKGTSVADSRAAPMCEPPGVNAMCLPPPCKAAVGYAFL